MTSSASGVRSTAPPLVEGTVVDVRREADEPPDFDLAGTLFAIILILDILAILAIILIPLFIVLVVLMLLLAFLGMTGIMAPFMHLGLFAFLSFLHRPGQRAGEKVPVTYLRLQDGSGAEYDVRMKGFLRSGSVAPSDVLRVWGREAHGVILLDRALNVRTGAWIEIRRRYTQAMLAILVILNLLLIAAVCAGTQ